MSIQKLFVKILISCLLVSALYTTISTMTNLNYVDIMESFAEETQMDELSNVKKRKMDLPKKTFNRLIERKRYISSEQVEGPKTLEEVMDVSQFPSTNVTATGYTAGVESTGKTPDHPEYGITYSGVKVKRDLYSTIAADINVFPLGTILYIPNYGYGVVTDIGGAIKGNKIDLYFETVEDVYTEWGKQDVEVYVIEEGDGTISEKELEQLNENKALQVFREQIRQKS